MLYDQCRSTCDFNKYSILKTVRTLNYQKDYYKSFINYFDKFYNRTYSKIAELYISNEDDRDYSRTINRYHEILLGGKSTNTNSMGRKLVTMLLVLQENAEFNPKHHTFIDEIETHKIEKFSYKWDDRAAKWQETAELFLS